MWALSQHCHGPLAELPLHKHTHTQGHTNRLCPLGFCSVVCFSWHGYKRIPTHISVITRASTDIPPSHCLTQFLLSSHCFLSFSLCWFVLFCCLFLSLLYLAPHHSPFLYLDCLLACSLTSFLTVSNKQTVFVQLYVTLYKYKYVVSLPCGQCGVSRSESEQSGCLVRRREQHMLA